MIKAEWTNKDALDLQPTCNKLATNAEPKTDGVLEQIRWERDVALKTLEEHGIGFAEEPKTGEWIQDDDYICDQCGYHMTVGGGAYNFCPNCGAKMGGGDDE